jgi:hypothetical protein
MVEKKAMLAKIEAAKREIVAAEGDLDKVLRAIDAAPRAEKTTISDVVRTAFADVQAARKRLGELEKLIADDTDD